MMGMPTKIPVMMSFLEIMALAAYSTHHHSRHQKSNIETARWSNDLGNPARPANKDRNSDNSQ